MKSSAWFLPPQAPRILFVSGSVQTVFFPGLVGALVGATFLYPSFFSPIHLFFLILKVLSKAFEVLFFFQLEYICFTCCVSFCCRAKWISYTYTHISSFLDFLPVSVTTEHQVELLVQSSSFSSVIYFIHEKKVEVLVAQSCLTLCDPMDCTYQAPQSVEFSRQEYWNGLPLPSPEDLPNPGIESASPALQADSSPFESPGKMYVCWERDELGDRHLGFYFLIFIYLFGCIRSWLQYTGLAPGPGVGSGPPAVLATEPPGKPLT